ncbi:DEAD/DEAH box helicase (plasmid) [Anabaena sp. FACHB-709]|uniref:Putative helicase n=1 Tax=Trichormus variabilis NIES-23 TaxID=1973479 RepID=A0A1Z4KVV9_ANAVA|nr:MULTISPECIES: DEAD/DEAH box helicase [Nostocaceae]BAY73165.1 putative helicase [Trichormus variabilis NIES-23]HBW30329.1 ATP-dependent helicase [Nostoc sp. UBA8866]MBD2266845.1 DEAD/DEAH box helicase [Anabaena sp. FACHB-709]MBD2276666.1 DEAD/DEAH box helicase [Nostoc sp. PCC 7120 = FACHB-418]MBD2284212.1 DEAD/DEAH box helicase [Anabaena cylindrica FACHB-170]
MTKVACIYELRNYQHQWIKDIWNSWKRGNRRVLAQLPTGAGKTICFAHICQKFFQKQQKVLVIAHRIELITQAAEKLEQIVGEPVGIIKGGCAAHPERRIQVASIQTLARRDILELPLNIGLLLFDEAHHSSASSYRRLIEHYQEAQILGVTATPQRIDGQGFQELFDDLVVGISTSTLIKEGYLSKFRLFTTNQTISTIGVKKSRGDFRAKELAVAVTSQIGVDEIFQNYLKYAKNLRTVIFACSLEHSRALAAKFRRNGIKAEHLDGETPPELRVQILERFRGGETQVITNYEILTEGYDCPNIECIYCVRPTESSTLWLQMTGRVLRTHTLKPTAVIIDVTDNWKKHGLPDEQRQWSLEAKTLTASSSLGLIQCPHCTHAFKPLSHELAIVDGEIGEDGLLIEHHEAICPNCGQAVEFTTKETTEPILEKTYRIRIRHSLNIDLTEIDLSVSGTRLEMVYDMLYEQRLKNAQPAKIYKAIFMTFIERMSEFTLGDWRAIVKMIEPTELAITKKAWELYQEALDRHKNRLLALSFIEQRKLKNQDNPQGIKSTTDKPQTLGSTSKESVPKQQPQSPLIKENLGNVYFQRKYAQEWQKSLAKCSVTTAEFLSQNAGLFHVETTPKFVNISLEIENVPDLKLKLKEVYNSTEIQSAFSQGFGKQAKVMLRLAPSQTQSQSA